MDTLMPVTVNKVPNVAIDVSDLILTDCGEAPVRVMIQWHENVDPRFNDDTSDSLWNPDVCAKSDSEQYHHHRRDVERRRFRLNSLHNVSVKQLAS